MPVIGLFGHSATRDTHVAPMPRPRRAIEAGVGSAEQGTWVPFLVFCTTITLICVATGTLLPFSFDKAAIGPGDGFGLSRMTWTHSPLADIVTNVCVYVPVGAFVVLLSAALRSGDQRRIIPWVLAATAFGVGISLGLECLQTMISRRVPSWIDVCMNGTGALIGACAASFRSVLNVVMRRVLHSLNRQPITAAVKLMTIGVLAYHLLPFDLVTTNEALWRSLGRTRIQPTFFDVSPQQWIAWLGYAGQFALIGIVALLASRETGLNIGHSAMRTLGHLAGLALLIEVLQVFTASHAFDVMDWIAGVFGGVAGMICGVCIAASGRVPSLRTSLAVILTCQVLYLGVDSAAPFNLSWGHLDGSRLLGLPFWSYWKSPFFVAVGRLSQLSITYGLLAGVLWLVLRGLARPARLMIVLMGVFGVASTCQMLQMITATRHGDVTDPLVAVCTAAAVIALQRPMKQVLAPASTGRL